MTDSTREDGELDWVEFIINVLKASDDEWPCGLIIGRRKRTFIISDFSLISKGTNFLLFFAIKTLFFQTNNKPQTILPLGLSRLCSEF